MTQTLTFTPEPNGRRQLSIRSVENEFQWRLRIPERVFCDEAVLAGHDIRRVHDPVEWTQDVDGTWRYQRKNRQDTNRDSLRYEIDYEVMITPKPYGANLKLSFRNTGTRAIHNLAGHICLGHLSPQFRDPEHKRTYFLNKGKLLNAGDTDRGSDPIRTHYRVRGFPAIKLFNNPTNRFWGPPSKDIADDGMILTLAEDTRHVVALWFDPASELFQNSDEPNMCIHSDPHYGDLEPGAEKTVEGRLILFEGGLQDFESAYLH